MNNTMQPMKIGRKSPGWPLAIDQFGQFGNFSHVGHLMVRARSLTPTGLAKQAEACAAGDASASTRLYTGAPRIVEPSQTHPGVTADQGLPEPALFRV
jgi:hypothetical protein